MRVLFIASDTNALGGIQQYNRKFLARLAERGDEVVLVELKGSGLFAKTCFLFRALWRGISFRPAVTICAHVHYAPLGFFMKKLLERKYIVCTHGIDVWEIRSALTRTALRGADLVTTVAEFTRDKMVSQIPDIADRVYFLYNCTDGNRFVPKPAPEALVRRYHLEGKKVIFTISRLLAIEGYKGYDRVIRAMPAVLRAVPNAVFLVGGSGDDVPRIERLVDEMGLRSAVVLAGRVSEKELVDHYNLADVFVMPSKAEGAPAVFIEALACGIPVIGGNRDGSATPIQNGAVGLLIDPESIDAIAEAIIGILTRTVRKELLDPDFLRKTTLEKFGLDKLRPRIDEMFRRVI